MRAYLLAWVAITAISFISCISHPDLSIRIVFDAMVYGGAALLIHGFIKDEI